MKRLTLLDLLVVTYTSIVLVITVPAVAEACRGKKNSWGDCTDPGRYHISGGHGDCGECTNRTVTYIGGTCAGSGEGSFDCINCTHKPKVRSYKMKRPTITSGKAAECLADFQGLGGITPGDLVCVRNRLILGDSPEEASETCLNDTRGHCAAKKMCLLRCVSTGKSVSAGQENACN